MAVFGFLEWCRRLHTIRFAVAGEPPAVPPEPACAEREGPVPLDDGMLKAYAMQQREWAEALIDVENARVEGEVRLLTTRLLLGTACGSVLLFSIAVSTRVAPSLGPGAFTPLTTTVLGGLGAALVTALAAGAGRALRRRPSAQEQSAVNDPANPVAEPPAESGPGRGGGP
ncbi:hypothetical protein OK074_4560 [Actinobacteria bacterium OK074]|nr:hypothetical protein OK074_4560 [Actinobacteria bacterium OK074]